MRIQKNFPKNRSHLISILVAFGLILATKASASNATFSLSPSGGTFTPGQSIKVQVLLNTNGNQVNAGEASINFSQDTLRFIGISKSGLFSFWQTEPSLSGNNIRFVGGRNSSYSNSGTLFTINFQAIKEGSAEVNFASGRILAADGDGTSVYGGASGASWRISATPSTPVGNAPTIPEIKSSSHKNQNSWYNSKLANFTWDLPTNVNETAVTIDNNPDTNPTNFEKATNKLETQSKEGTFYVHVRFKNKFGISPTAHYKFLTDLTPPEKFTITYPTSQETNNNKNRIGFDTIDTLSGVAKYTLQIDDSEEKQIQQNEDRETELTNLAIGKHNLIITAYDHAGNFQKSRGYIIIQKASFPWCCLIAIFALILSIISLFLNLKVQIRSKSKKKSSK